VTHHDVIVRFVNSALSGDFETTASLMQPTLVIVEAASLPYGGTYRGMDGLKQLLANIAGCYDSHNVRIISVIGEPDGTEFGLLIEMDVSKGGRRLREMCFDWCLIRDGKLAEMRIYYWDTKTVLDFLDAPPAL
jgi:hypothetical protein